VHFLRNSYSKSIPSLGTTTFEIFFVFWLYFSVKVFTEENSKSPLIFTSVKTFEPAAKTLWWIIFQRMSSAVIRN
jgi:hypothetical protein